MAAKEKERFVAHCEEIYSGYRWSQDLTVVSNFNNNVLPILKDLDAFDVKDINYYSHKINEEYIFAAVLRQALAKSGDGIGAEVTRVKALEIYRNWLNKPEHYVPTFNDWVSEKGMQYTRYDEEKGEFVIDAERYEADTTVIYARTPEELKALELLENLVKALNALKLDKFNLPTRDGELGAVCFIEFKDGRAQLCELMHPGAFRSLAERVK